MASTSVSASGLLRPAGSWPDVGIAGLTVVVTALVLARQFTAGLDYDESYNLTVVENLVEGRGYSSNGALSGGSLLLFDPHVTTGPTVLLPVAGGWWASGGGLWAARLMCFAFFVGLLAAIFGLWRDRSGTSAGIGAVAFVFALSTVPGLTLLGLVPGRVVGEVAATALLVGSAWALARDHAGLAGLLAGLAVQTKAVMLFSSAILFGFVLLERLRRRDQWSTSDVVRCVVGCLLPTAAFEGYRLLTLGAEGYRDSIEQLRDFSATQVGETDPVLRLGGLMLLYTPYSILCVLAVLATLGLMTIVATKGPATRNETRPSLREERARAAIYGLLLAATASLASWVIVSTQSSARQALPAAILLTSALGGTVFARARSLEGAGGPAVIWRVVVLVFTAIILLSAAWSALTDHATDQQLRNQLEAARILEASGTPTLPVRGWDQNPEFQVLTDIPPQGADHPAEPAVDVYTWVSAPWSWDARDAATECPRRFLWTRDVVICER